MSARSLKLLLGKCVPCVKPNASKICVPFLEFDDNLHMYFREFKYFIAHDPQKSCKSGDIVLIEELQQKLTPLITHTVKKVVYPLGDVTDPVSGRKVQHVKFREEIKEENQLYGEWKNSFDYSKAPPRGWQEGKRDFSDKDTYVKFHDDGKEHPYAK